jgi:hypothetical protein
MFISSAQLKHSLERLKDVHPFFGTSYLAFKRAKVPVGKTMNVVLAQIGDDIMTRYYKPSASHQGFYNPFDTSKPKQRWLAPRYSNTSLQRFTKDTFRDAVIHPEKSSEWGWKPAYVQALQRHLNNRRVPAFDLAVWLFRNENWPPDTTRAVVRDRLFSEFGISKPEVRALFDTSISSQPKIEWLSSVPVLEPELLSIIGRPPGSLPEEGAALRSLELHHIGPASNFHYEPAERLNIITGDNSLGKTFLLECIWWALTGEWIEHQVQPRASVGKRSPKIISAVTVGRDEARSVTSRYNWDKQSWERPTKREMLPGFVIYARYDGSFAIWDPARLHMPDEGVASANRPKAHLLFSRDQIWNGLVGVRSQSICNGLIRDWVLWQTGGDRYIQLYGALVASLRSLSETPDGLLEPGEPVRLPFDARDIPTVRMSYGEVPVVFASAGVQRIIALAYILVWAWHEHLANSSVLRREPQRRVVLMIDEVEAHLHPRWQRVIVPALMKVVSELASAVTPQVHLATHSPMILASAETIFDEELDDLHHLKQVGSDVLLEEIPFVKRGRSDWWLISDVFGLRHPRSLPAEQVIEKAKALQLSSNPTKDSVESTNAELIRVLAPDDEFWPRWRSFALAHTVKS